MDLFDKLFSPIGLYIGSLTVDDSIIEDNSSKSSKKLYVQWKKKVLDELDKKVQSEPLISYIKQMPFVIESTLNVEGTRREIYLDKLTIYCTLLENFYPKNPNWFEGENGYCMSEENLYSAFKNELYAARKELHDIINGKLELEESAYATMYFDYVNVAVNRIKSKKEFAEYIKNALMAILPSVKYLDAGLNKPLDLCDLKFAIDSEEFRLAMAIYVVKNSLEVKKIEGSVHNSLIYAVEYFNATYGLDKKVTAKVEGVTYTYNDFVNMYEKIRFENPEFTVFKLDNTGDEQIDIEYLIKKSEEVRSMSKMSVNWNILPSGNVVKTEMAETSHKQNSTDNDLKRRHIMKIKTLLDSSDPIMIISGMNDFLGYIGYIYANGVVVFEKIFNYYKSSEDYSIAIDNATYVMGISNFIELSKETKIDLITKIRNGEAQAIRIRHDHTASLENWTKKMQECILAGERTLKREDLSQYFTEEEISRQ